LAGYEALTDEFAELGASLFAATVDDRKKTAEVATDLSFPVAHGVSRVDADLIGAWWEPRRDHIQPNEFLLTGQGVPRWEMLVPVFVPSDGGSAVPNPDFFGSLLLGTEQTTSIGHPARSDSRNDSIEELRKCASAELEIRCTELRHPNDLVLLAAADLHNK
ncbi:MAG: hypothetical protein OXE83_16060, partial [Gammaproteobacteria bacterium]|nr:hypothetical protein [Gammaproteobacteria bacterium]